LRRNGFEFLSIFIAVVSAFALNNWNETRKANTSENKILLEIANGLEKDIDDIKQNIKGHEWGIDAFNYFKEAITNKDLKTDSVVSHYTRLTRDFVSIQNTAGYETLKSRGLELIKNDSLRLQIISLYEFDYDILRKLEEEYSEMQFHKNYAKEINTILAANFIFDENNLISGINLPLNFAPEEKNKFLLYLFKIEGNRKYIMKYYTTVAEKVLVIREGILAEIES
jgi:hypothetical protein